MSEYLYAVRASESAPPFCGYLKIGRTNNLKSRLSAHQIGSPIPLYYAGVWVVLTRGIAIRLERACHQTFLGRHVHGEWHEISIAELANYIAKEAHDQGIAFSSAFDGSDPGAPRQQQCGRIGALVFAGATGFEAKAKDLVKYGAAA